MDDEERGIGKVTAAVYMLYVSASGGIPLLLIYIFFVIIWAAVGLIGTFWLAKWANAMAETHPPHSSWFYLDFFMIIKFSTIFVSIGSGTTSLIMRLKASKFLHEKLLDKMLKSPMSFFDTTPIGRIINRFSRDVYSVDSAVPGSYTNTISIFIGLISAAIGVGIATPIFAISLIPLSIIYYYIQKYFIATSRELRRLSTLMNSPIYSNYAESIAGSLVIRSFNKIDEFSFKNKTMIDKDHQAYYASVASNRWLAIRLELIGNCLIGFTALSCAITRPSAGLVGVALSIVMSITQYLNWFVRSKAQLEQDIVAVERIDQYSNEDTLQEKDNKDVKTAINWPNKGEISFNNIHMKYRNKLPFVLKGLTFDIKGGEKIGVIGRTGAGKTSLFVTLLRLVELKKGEIIIDNINISNICLYDLRSKISVIPQDPTLFTGTVRFNLDPFKERNDDELIKSLKLSHCLNALKKMIIEVTIKKEKDEEEKKRKEEEEKANKKKKKKNKIIENIKPKEEEESISKSKSIAINVSAFMNRPKYKDLNPLDLEVEENGSNFSVGQRQLLCLARAIVRKSKILLLDEATSAVDHQTDQLIQETIRDVFKNNTILTIAHRINTILDYDRILIMENGNVLEFDTVSSLLQNKNSKFSDIVQTSFGVNIEDVINLKINKQNKLKNKNDIVINQDQQLQQDDANKT